MIDPDRLIEIRAGGTEGSGYLVAPRLVLTAWHVVKPLTAQSTDATILVRQYRGKKIRQTTGSSGAAAVAQRARPIWPSEEPEPDHDFALLMTELATGPPHEPVSWIELPRTGRLVVEGQGFPDSSIFVRPWLSMLGRKSAREREIRGISGHVSLASGLRQRETYGIGTFDVILSLEDQLPGPKEGWQGMSGAPLFDAHYLVGVVRDVSEARGNQAFLKALPAERLFSRQDVQKAIRAAGLEPPIQGRPRNTVAKFNPVTELHLLDRTAICTDILLQLDKLEQGTWPANQPQLLALRSSQRDSEQYLFQRLKESELADYARDFLVKRLEWPSDACADLGQQRLKRMLRSELVADRRRHAEPLDAEQVKDLVPDGVTLFIHCSISTAVLDQSAEQRALLDWWRSFWVEISAHGVPIVVLMVFEDDHPPEDCCVDPFVACRGELRRSNNVLPSGIHPAWHLLGTFPAVESRDLPAWLNTLRARHPEWGSEIQELAAQLEVEFDKPRVLPRGLRCIKLGLKKLLEHVDG